MLRLRTAGELERAALVQRQRNVVAQVKRCGVFGSYRESRSRHFHRKRRDILRMGVQLGSRFAQLSGITLSECRGVDCKPAPGTDPTVSIQRRCRGWRTELWPMHCTPSRLDPGSAIAFEGSEVDLTHPRIEADYNALACASLCHRQQRAHARNRKPCSESKSLCYSTRDAQACERARPRAKRDRVKVSQTCAGLLQQLVDYRQDQLRMTLARQRFVREHPAITPSRNGAPVGGRLERKDIQNGEAREHRATGA